MSDWEQVRTGPDTVGDDVHATKTYKEAMKLVVQQEKIKAESASEQRAHELKMQELKMEQERQAREFEIRRLELLQAANPGQPVPSPARTEGQAGSGSNTYKGSAVPKFNEGDDVDAYLRTVHSS